MEINGTSINEFKNKNKIKDPNDEKERLITQVSDQTVTKKNISDQHNN